jgi:hypothetical protein
VENDVNDDQKPRLFDGEAAVSLDAMLCGRLALMRPR